MNAAHATIIDGLMARLGDRARVLTELYQRAETGTVGSHKSGYGAKLVYDIRVESSGSAVVATDDRSGFKLTLSGGKLRIDRAIVVEADRDSLTTYALFV